MSTPPVIPPRPSRSPNPSSSLEMPKIPPRPGNRRNDRSVSPAGNSYAPSPLNEWSGPRMDRTISNEPPRRPPSVTIPSLGEEGIEYADLDTGNVSDSHQTPAETRNVSSDLKIHAPRPSLPTSSAEAKVQAVTRTDSRQAAAAGLGRGVSPSHEDDRTSRSPHTWASSVSRAGSSCAPKDRRHSAQPVEEHYGIRVPMYPDAGDVQAPSPGPYLDQGSQRSGRDQNSSCSARGSSLPPGSYGSHGHGVCQYDIFEKAWREKHPEEQAREQAQYSTAVSGPRRGGEMSSEALNKIVRGPVQTRLSVDNSPAVVGTPEEELGYLAADAYVKRITSTSPTSDAHLENQATADPTQTKRAESSLSNRRRSSHTHRPLVIHVDDPVHRMYHPDGFSATPASEIDDPTSADGVKPKPVRLHPAISPTFEHRYSFEHDSHNHTGTYTRPKSPPKKIYDHWRVPFPPEKREDTQMPPRYVVETGPLFPEDKDQTGRPKSAAERFKRRPDFKHRFPSQDLWEDAPDSSQLHATVMTPELVTEDHSDTFETPEQEATRRMQTAKVDSHQVAKHILEGESAVEKPVQPDQFNQRFPSKDIWEEAPDSQRLVTTIEPADEKEKSPDTQSKPMVPPRPPKQTQLTSPTEKKQPPTIPDKPKPQVPHRPAKPSSQETTPDAPQVKTKPAVPARPGGSKIAALKAGFLTDLNSRLQLGPQQPKPQEQAPEAPVEKQPLADARKGRARGPIRRKPAVKEKEMATTTQLPTAPKIKVVEPLNVWQVGRDGKLVIGTSNKVEDPPIATKKTSVSSEEPTTSPIAAKKPSVSSEEPTTPPIAANKPSVSSEEPTTSPIAAKEPSVSSEQPMAPPIAKNIAGESVDPAPISPVPADFISPQTSKEEVEPAHASTEASEPTEPSVATIEPTSKPTNEDKREENGGSPVSATNAQEFQDLPTSPKLDDALETMTTPADAKRE